MNGVSTELKQNRSFSTGKKIGASFVSFDELLNRSDFVIVACPLNNETKNLFDKNAFGKMKRNAVFVNVARGGRFASLLFSQEFLQNQYSFHKRFCHFNKSYFT